LNEDRFILLAAKCKPYKVYADMRGDSIVEGASRLVSANGLWTCMYNVTYLY